MRLLSNTVHYFQRLAKFIGPGFMVAVGYLDPGNWATDMEGGSQFGYRLLFIILISNLIAIFLQNLTIRLGTVTGLDLAASCRRYLPGYLSLFLYVLAEAAIIATDLAEVIGSAIALNLLFPTLPLPAGVAITALDVLIILLCYKEPESETDDDNDDMKSRQDNTIKMVRYFEMFVMMLVAAVGICFIIELAYSDIVAVDVLKGYLPSKEIFTDTEALYVSIGIIGATVMPHNLFLHSYIVQARCYPWRQVRPKLIGSNANTTTIPNNSNNNVNGSIADDQEQGAQTIRFTSHLLVSMDKQQQEQQKKSGRSNIATPLHHQRRRSSVNEKQQGDHSTVSTNMTARSSGIEPHQTQQTGITSIEHLEEEERLDMGLLRHFLSTNLHINLHYGFVDLMVALLFAFFVNSAILIVASANFHYGHLHVVSDLFDAHALLQQYLGPAAAVIFALALLFAGQSSTLTATLAGQVVMSGFLGMTSRPWLRRIVTRLIAIVPAMIAACVAGRSGLSQMLVASQVALSIQLPFAVVPLVVFTSMPRVMQLDLVSVPKWCLPPALPIWLDKLCMRMCQGLDRVLGFMSRKWALYSAKQRNLFTWWRHSQSTSSSASSATSSSAGNLDKQQVTVVATSTITAWPEPIYYANGKCTIAVAVLISLILIGLNAYLVVSTILGN